MTEAKDARKRVLSKNEAKPFISVVGATRAAFGAVGFGMAGWAPLVPFAKLRLEVDDGVLGLLLLCLGIGSFATMPFAGALVGRVGCRGVILGGSVCLAACLPMLAAAGSVGSLAAALLLFGAALGAADVAMNVQAVIVEQTSRRAVMSGFHAFFSLGCIVGAGGISLALRCGASPLAAASGAAVLLIGGLIPFGGNMLPDMSPETGTDRVSRLFIRPKGVVLLIGCLCFVAFLTEGAMLDWSGVFLTGARHLPAVEAGAGYALFSLAMTLSRLCGDMTMRRFGPRYVVAGGALCAVAGLALTVSVASTPAALAGFVMVGLGIANLVPAFYSALGRQTVMPANLAIAAGAALGYAGLLVGPALIGFAARAVSLSAAFICIGGLLCLVAASTQTIPAPRE